MKIRNIINSTIALFMVLTFASCDALDLKPISFIISVPLKLGRIKN